HVLGLHEVADAEEDERERETDRAADAPVALPPVPHERERDGERHAQYRENHERYRHTGSSNVLRGVLPRCGVNDVGRSAGPHRVGDDGCRRVSVISEAELVSQYRTHVRPLYAYVARRTGGNRQLAEDVVQETWLRALRDWRCNGLPREPLAWLSRVASNLLASYFRAQKPHTSLDVTQLLDDEVPQAPTREA